MNAPLSPAEASWMDRPLSAAERPYINLMANAAAQPVRRSVTVEYGRLTWTLRGQYSRANGEGVFDVQVAEPGESIENMAEFLADEVTSELAELAVAKIEQEDEDASPEAGICPHCSGSGEGMHDGSRCWSCRGAGVEAV